MNDDTRATIVESAVRLVGEAIAPILMHLEELKIALVVEQTRNEITIAMLEEKVATLTAELTVERQLIVDQQAYIRKLQERIRDTKYKNDQSAKDNMK